MLDQKQGEINETLKTLKHERESLATRLTTATITDEHIQSLEAFARDIGDELETADFELRRQIVEALNVTGTFAREAGQKILYLHWYAQTEKFCIVGRTLRRSSLRARSVRRRRARLAPS